MVLVTTGMTELHDLNDDVVLLGPWCLRYDRAAEWAGRQYVVLPTPWTDAEAITQAERYCAGVIDRLLDQLGPWLNAIHRTTHGDRYWRILLGPWLLQYIHVLYDRYISLTRAFDTYADLRTVALDPSTYITPLDSTDFHSLLRGDAADLYNLQLYSQVLCRLKPGAVDGAVVPRAASALAAARPSSGVAWSRTLRMVRSRLHVALNRFVHPQVVFDEMNLTPIELLRLMGAMTTRGWALPMGRLRPDESMQPDGGLREGLRSLGALDAFGATALDTLPANLPMVYLEGYAEFREACVAACPRTPVIMSTDWHKVEALKFLAAEATENGTRLVGMQHGGGYGVSEVLPQETHERAIADTWFTYGWTDGDDRARPLPHPRFTLRGRAAARSGRERGDVLVMTMSAQRYPGRFQSDGYWAGHFPELLEWRRAFVAALPETVRRSLLMRLQQPDFGWCQKERLLDEFPTLRFDAGGAPVHEAFPAARLVVIEYNGTSCLEALAADVPTVLFWRSGTHEVRDRARGDFEQLRAVGVLFDTPQAASAQVARVFDNPHTWWAGANVQQARRRFVGRYALGTSDWLRHWTDALVVEVKRAGTGQVS